MRRVPPQLREKSANGWRRLQGRARSLTGGTGEPVVDDLDTQRRAIVDKVAKDDAVEGLDLMWRFMALAELRLRALR